MDHKNKQEVEFFRVCAWQIWSSRNKFFFEKIYIAPDLCYKRAHDILSEYKRANSMEDRAKERRVDLKWVPPNMGFIKVNIDMAVNSKENRVGLGLLLEMKLARFYFLHPRLYGLLLM